MNLVCNNVVIFVIDSWSYGIEIFTLFSMIPSMFIWFKIFGVDLHLNWKLENGFLLLGQLAL